MANSAVAEEQKTEAFFLVAGGCSNKAVILNLDMEYPGDEICLVCGKIKTNGKRYSNGEKCASTMIRIKTLRVSCRKHHTSLLHEKRGDKNPFAECIAFCKTGPLGSCSLRTVEAIMA